MEEIPYQVVSLEQLPPQLKNQAQQALHSTQETIQLLSADSKKYVILSLGKKTHRGIKSTLKKWSKRKIN